jgi:hypothetical protein
MSETHHPYDPDQMFLLPPSLVERLPKDHLVFFVRDVLDKIDLSPIMSVYEQEERGFLFCRYVQADRVPESWRAHGGVFIPMYQRVARWLEFQWAEWKPNAVKIGIGMINVLSGRPWDQSLSRGKQDYVVVPDQPWLDGINTGRGVIRQFVADQAPVVVPKCSGFSFLPALLSYSPHSSTPN